MDPFAAIGLAGNIINFIEFGHNVISKAKDIRNSTSGSSSANNALASMTQRLQDVTLSLQGGGPTAASSQSQSLAQLGMECHEVSEELLNLLENLRAKDPTSKRSIFRAALREMAGSKKEQVHQLERRLDRCRQQLNLELVNLARSESYERLSKLVEYGLSSQDELASLSKNMQCLRSGVQVKSLDPAAIEQVLSIVNLSNQAIKKVRESRILNAVRFELMDERFHDVKEAHEETFDWIFSSGCTSGEITNANRENSETTEQARLSFRSWLEYGDGIFHISGKPGAGKSTLMKYLCRSPNTQKSLNTWADDKVLVFSQFFFWRPSTELQKSLSGLIRGLLYSLLSNSPDLIPVALPAQWEQSQVQENIHLDRDQICTAFNTVISSHDSCLNHKFAIFIDGLDEFTGNHAELIQQLFQWTGRTKDVKICVSSREWTIFQVRFNECPKMKLHELTRSDIVKVVRDQLGDSRMVSMLQEGECNAKELETSIADKSDGVFLWVIIILRLIEDGLINGDVMTDLQRKIDSLPTELEVMFQYLFDSISKADQQLAYLILDMVLLVSKTKSGQCCLSRYSFLEDYLTDRNFAAAMPPKPLGRTLIASRLKRAQSRVYGVCKGFLELVPYSAEEGAILPTFAEQLGEMMSGFEAEREVSNLFGGSVKFTHRSVAEFLSGRAIRQRIDETLLEIDTFDACCQTLLAQIKAISLHQPGLCYPDAASSIKRQYGDFRTGINLINFPSTTTVRSKLIPAWFSDNLFDIAKIAATKANVNKVQFEKLINNIAGAAAAFALEPRRLELIDADMRHIRPNRTFILDLSVVPSLAIVVAGFPLSRTTLNPAINLWMLLGTMEEIMIFGNQRQASSMLQNLRLYLALNNTPNEDSTIPGVPRWHFFLWKSCWGRAVLPVIALFLYYGANPSFWIVRMHLKKDQPSRMETAGDIRFWFESGAGPSQSPEIGQVIRVDDLQCHNRESYWRRSVKHVSKDYLEFWERHNYRLSFRELVRLWFPMHAKKLEEIIDWLTEQGGELSVEKRRELQDKFGAYLRLFFEIDTIEGWRSMNDTGNAGDWTVDCFGSMAPGEVMYIGA